MFVLLECRTMAGLYLNNHLFLHCLIGLYLWLKLFREAYLCKVIPAECVASFVERHKFFGWEEEGYDFEKMCGDGYFLGNLGGEIEYFLGFSPIFPLNYLVIVNLPPELISYYFFLENLGLEQFLICQFTLHL